ncbi:MAG: SDR family NAD(P)-dependent oxidoreductase [Acidobacteriota bacterium]|nr:SDR family NAD(P)-dependent oxidoreductase [Acidobacteriota bacterium]
MSARAQVAHVVDEALEASVVGSFTRLGYVARSRLEKWRDPAFVLGRRVVITGATSGLGLAAAARLARLGAHVHLVGRSETKLTSARAHVQLFTSGEVWTHRCDLSLLNDARDLARELSALSTPVDALVHNAGALLPAYTETREGLETTLATHLLSPYLLTEYLLAHGGLAAHARVITMTSGGMYTERFDLAQLMMTVDAYRGTTAYARAKRAQCVLTPYWQRAHAASGVSFHLVHPGWAATPGLTNGIPLFERAVKPLLRTPDQGADTLVWLVGAPTSEPTGGQLWLDRHPRRLYRLKKTHLSAPEEFQAGEQLASWCDERIARALNEA